MRLQISFCAASKMVGSAESVAMMGSNNLRSLLLTFISMNENPS